MTAGSPGVSLANRTEDPAEPSPAPSATRLAVPGTGPEEPEGSTSGPRRLAPPGALRAGDSWTQPGGPGAQVRPWPSQSAVRGQTERRWERLAVKRPGVSRAQGGSQAWAGLSGLCQRGIRPFPRIRSRGREGTEADAPCHPSRGSMLKPMVSSLCCPTTGQKGLPAGSSDPGPALLTLCNCSSHGGFQAALDPLGAPGGRCPKTLDTASLGASQRSGERREEAHRGEVGRGGQCGAGCPLGHLRWSCLRMTSAHWAHRPPPCWFWKAPPAKHGCEPLSPCPVPTP